MRRCPVLFLACLVLGLPGADIETLTGQVMAGVEIDEETDAALRFRQRIDGQWSTMTLPKRLIHRLRDKADGPWRVLNAKAEAPPPPPKPVPAATSKVVDPPPPPKPAPGMMWRGDGSGRFAVASAPVRWSAGENVRWKAELPAWGNGSPIVVGDRVVCGAEPHAVLCFAASTGTMLWRTDNPPPEVLGPGNPDPGMVEPKRLRGWTCPTPASDGAVVVAAFGQGMLIGFDLATGKRIWARPFGVDGQWGRELSASPLIIDGTVVQLGNGAVHAFALADGSPRWTADGGSGLHGSPAPMVLDGVKHLVLPEGRLLRVSDGKKVCDQAPEGGKWRNWGPSPAVAGDVAVIHFHGHPANDTVIHAYRYAADGKRTKLWDFDPEPESTYFTRMGNSPLVHDGLVYAVTDGGHLQVLDLATGALVYEQKWDKHSYSSLALAGGNLYATGKSRMHVFKAGRTYESVADFDHGFVRHEVYPWLTVASPVFSDAGLFFRDRTHLWCIGPTPAIPSKPKPGR